MEVDGINLAVGGGAVTAIAGVAGALIKARFSRTKVEPDPLNIRKEDKYVTRGEFNRHVEDNARDHENLFNRLNRNDMITSEVNAKLGGIKEDLTLIKQKLFRTK